MDGMTKTEINLFEAFVGEAKATVRLRSFADKADQEGYPQIAKLFRAVSAAEFVHATRCLRLLGIINSTEENLQKSFESETIVSENHYTEFIQQAEADENSPARIAFTQSKDAEEFHAKLYKLAMGDMAAERESAFHVCQVCGYVVDGEPPEECPVCGAKRKFFLKVE
jgi:rubrerythrin